MRKQVVATVTRNTRQIIRCQILYSLSPFCFARSHTAAVSRLVQSAVHVFVLGGWEIDPRRALKTMELIPAVQPPPPPPLSSFEAG